MNNAKFLLVSITIIVLYLLAGIALQENTEKPAFEQYRLQVVLCQNHLNYDCDYVANLDLLDHILIEYGMTQENADIVTLGIREAFREVIENK